MKLKANNPLFTRSEKKRARKKVVHKIKGAARKGFASLFGIPLSPGLGGAPASRRGHRGSARKAVASGVRSDVVSALMNQGYKKSQAESMVPREQSGEGFDALFRRAVRSNPGELIIFGNPAKVYARKKVAAMKRAGNPIPAAILEGFEWSLGSKGLDLLSKRRRRKSKKNPASKAEELFETFHHRGSSGTFETHRSAKMRKEFTILGPLVAIGINAGEFEKVRSSMSKMNWEDYKVEHFDKLPHLAFLTGPQVEHVKKILEEPDQYVKDCPQLASSPNGKQLYAITPDGVEIDLRQFDTDTTKEFVDLGEATFVVYIAKKPDQAVEWVHELGEEAGTRPRLALNRLGKKELFFVGGSYRVEGPGIIN